MQKVDKVFMRSPQGDEIREVDATPQALTPLMVSGWHQVPAPVAAAANEKETN